VPLDGNKTMSVKLPNPIPKNRSNEMIAFSRLLDIMDELREKCPWDKKQTFDSLRHLTIEETYELSDAILEKNSSEIKKELTEKLEEFATYNDSLEEIFENKEQIEVSKFYEKLPKPHALAVQEWMDDKIYYRDTTKD
jgi:NTP pyrophosphatase (non-canonical NTP hydrolase)